MANHKSALKRIRQTKTRTIENKYYGKTTRNMIKKVREMNEKSEAENMLPKVFSMIDKLAKRKTIHKNKAGNLKSSLTKHVNNM